MKPKLLISTILMTLLFCNTEAFSQCPPPPNPPPVNPTIVGTPWGLDRHNTYWLNEDPNTNKKINQDEGGEDWMYTIKQSKNSSGTRDGYVMSGFAGSPNFLPRKGCDLFGVPSTAQLECVNPWKVKGEHYAAAMKIDENGKQLWFKTYTNELGEFWSGIQSKDNQAYYFCGYTIQYRTYQTSPISGDPMPYSGYSGSTVFNGLTLNAPPDPCYTAERYPMGKAYVCYQN